MIWFFSVGSSIARPEEVRFLYENHENFDVLPTFYIMPAMKAMFLTPMTNAVPGKTVSLENILHGEQYIEILGPLPTDGKLISKPKIVEVLDKSSGAVIIADSKYYFKI